MGLAAKKSMVLGVALGGVVCFSVPIVIVLSCTPCITMLPLPRVVFWLLAVPCVVLSKLLFVCYSFR